MTATLTTPTLCPPLLANDAPVEQGDSVRVIPWGRTGTVLGFTPEALHEKHADRLGVRVKLDNAGTITCCGCVLERTEGAN